MNENLFWAYRTCISVNEYLKNKTETFERFNEQTAAIAATAKNPSAHTMNENMDILVLMCACMPIYSSFINFNFYRLHSLDKFNCVLNFECNHEHVNYSISAFHAFSPLINRILNVEINFKANRTEELKIEFVSLIHITCIYGTIFQSFFFCVHSEMNQWNSWI